jgi:hypothetical protein
MTIHRGSCHCGKVAFEVEGEIGEVTTCNCSICSRRGSLLWFVSRACGIHSFGEGTDPKGNQVAAVNARCLEGIELSTLAVKNFNGRAL